MENEEISLHRAKYVFVHLEPETFSDSQLSTLFLQGCSHKIEV